MKKLLALALTLFMALGLLTACGTEPVAEDFENFLNVQMVTVNEKYEALKAEVATWSTMEEDSQMATSIRDTLLPLVNESMDLLSKMELNTDEVKAIRDKYNDVMVAYKTGFTTTLSALEQGSEDMLNQGMDELNNAISLLDVYNQALEALAATTGYEVQY
ncbi:MAG: hypothetical protein IJ367_01435 [Clostridia bacterium]|nr:hypothetical protein [Clostridia bacterium]